MRVTTSAPRPLHGGIVTVGALALIVALIAIVIVAFDGIL